MSDALTDIDRLIEEGLTLYGQGDLDGALRAWEQALLTDPDNAQATSYVDYVRMNYDLLTGDLTNEEERVPFGIDDEPYQIEILPGEAIQLSASSPQTNALDEGWFMDEEGAEPRRTMTLDADEPPEGAQPVTFDDQTREYPNKRPPSTATENRDSQNEFDEIEVTPGVDSPQQGFASQPTNLRERDTGFVKATGKPDRTKRPSQVPELMMTLRTPGEEDPYDDIGLPKEAPAPNASIAVSYDDPPTTERQLTPAALDLINSLPSPTPSPLQRSQTPSTPPRTETSDLPPAIRPPAAAPLGPVVPMPMPNISSTITQDFESQKTNAAQMKPSEPTRELTPDQIPAFAREMVSAPTRDLGLRPGSIADDDATGSRKAITRDDGTRSDVILPFDPIDARSATILDDVDDGAPDNEQKEERTRRRITALFDRATGWAQAGELDRAVAAIDLALSEDPNSALGQKLVHRHRDTMMHVFQAFLGNLDRQPVLARPLHELANAPISPRAAFLLSRIDGMVTLDELLDVSGMPRIEAYRYLCQLFLRGILR